MNVKLKRLPCARVGDVHAPLLATELCATLSLLSQLTVVPTETLSGFGEYAVLDNVEEPLTMVTVVLPAGAGSGVSDGDVELFPQAVRQTAVKRIALNRFIMVRSAPFGSGCLPDTTVPGARPRARTLPLRHAISRMCCVGEAAGTFEISNSFPPP